MVLHLSDAFSAELVAATKAVSLASELGTGFLTTKRSVQLLSKKQSVMPAPQPGDGPQGHEYIPGSE
jgi:hypothetical protein